MILQLLLSTPLERNKRYGRSEGGDKNAEITWTDGETAKIGTRNKCQRYTEWGTSTKRRRVSVLTDTRLFHTVPSLIKLVKGKDNRERKDVLMYFVISTVDLHPEISLLHLANLQHKAFSNSL